MTTSLRWKEMHNSQKKNIIMTIPLGRMVAYSRSAELRARFDSSHMSGGHGIWEPLEADPEIVFSWGFETGNHGFRKTITPIRNYWEQYFRARKMHAKGQATKFVISGLHSVGL